MEPTKGGKSKTALIVCLIGAGGITAYLLYRSYKDKVNAGLLPANSFFPSQPVGSTIGGTTTSSNPLSQLGNLITGLFKKDQSKKNPISIGGGPGGGGGAGAPKSPTKPKAPSSSQASQNPVQQLLGSLFGTGALSGLSSQTQINQDLLYANQDNSYFWNDPNYQIQAPDNPLGEYGVGAGYDAALNYDADDPNTWGPVGSAGYNAAWDAWYEQEGQYYLE